MASDDPRDSTPSPLDEGLELEITDLETSREPSSFWGGLVFFGFGVAVTIAGGIPFLTALGYLPEFEDKMNAPAPIVGAVAFLFVAMGLGLLYVSILSWSWSFRTRRLNAEFPNEPWHIDRRWDTEKAVSGTVMGLIRHFAVLLGLTIFLAPFNWAAYAIWGGLSWVAVGFFDLILLLVFLAFLSTLTHRLKYGVGVFRYNRFPFFLGESLEGEFTTTKSIGHFTRLTITLICKEAATVKPREGQSASSQNAFERDLYTDEQSFDAGGELDATAPAIPIVLPLPADQKPSLYLNGRKGLQKRRWILCIKADTPGQDFMAEFELPVYRREGKETESDLIPTGRGGR